MNSPPIILAAEDERSDAFIMRLVFEKAGVTNPLKIVSDGRDVVNYLTGAPPYEDCAIHPLPALLTLDLKMPLMSGFDVLDWLRTRPEFKDIPAVVISSSSDEADVKKARSLGARDYFVKLHQIEDFIAIVRTLQSRWLTSPVARGTLARMGGRAVSVILPRSYRFFIPKIKILTTRPFAPSRG